MEPETNSVIKSITPNKEAQVISEDTSALVRHALESVVANGSGRNAYIENYRVGGKTGTAQKVQDGHYMSGNYILSFIGFMPADDPEIVVYVAVDHPQGVVQYGGIVSAPIAKSVLQDAINILGIKPDEEGMPKEYNYLDTKYVVLPDVEGKTIKEANALLKGFKIEYAGTGEKVVYSSPSPGIFVKDGSTVKLLLG